MTRNEKIKLLTSLYKGHVSIAEILPKKLKIRIDVVDGKVSTVFFINNQEVAQYDFWEKHNVKDRFTVRIV